MRRRPGIWPSRPPRDSTGLALSAGAALSVLQALLWARIQFWPAAAGTLLLAIALGGLAIRLRHRHRARSPGDRTRLGTLLAWLVVPLVALVGLLPIREGALAGRSTERAVIAALVLVALFALVTVARLALRDVLRNPRLRKPVLLALACALIAVLLVDLGRWTRTSATSALACTGVLFHGRTLTARLLATHHDVVIEAASRQNLPATLLAAIIADHQNQQTLSGDFSDCVGSALGVNLSLGVSQIRISTAAQVDERDYAQLPPDAFRELRRRLLAPATNIDYAARELRALLDRPSRSPGIAAAALLQDPAAMALLVSEYRKGRMPGPALGRPLNINAFSTLELMQDGSLAQFDSPALDPERSRSAIRGYLDQIYCRSDLFNPDTCGRWQARLPAPEVRP